MTQLIVEAGDHYDLLVMGTDGADQMSDALFGTNPFHVAIQSSVPTLLLPFGCDYENFSNIVFAMDYFHDLAPPEQLIKWADLFEARIIFLQIITEEYKHRQDEKLSEAQQLLMNTLDAKHQNFKTVYSDRPVEGILDFISANECDVLALCYRHHSFFEKIFHKDTIKNFRATYTMPLVYFPLTLNT